MHIYFQRFGKIAGLFQVMSVAIRALDKDDVDPQYMAKLAKVASAEIISTKVHITYLELFAFLPFNISSRKM